MNKNKKRILTISLLIIIILSFVLFLGIGDNSKTLIQIISFVFIIIDEIIVYSTVLLLTERRQKAFSIAGIYSITSIYIVSSLIINVILKNIIFNLKTLLITNLAVLLTYLFITTLILLSKEEK